MLRWNPLRWIVTAGAAVASLLLGAPLFAQQGRRARPNALCIHSTAASDTADLDEQDVWITVPDHGYLGSPTFSPDGKWIAFDAYRSDTRKTVAEVWKVRVDGSDLQQLAVGATPRWSPDGTKLLFMRENRNRGDTTLHGIYKMDRDGANVTLICRGRWPDFSPDGSQIVFSRRPSHKTTRGGVEGLARIFIADANGTNAKALANGDCPSWSPDGEKIACSYLDPALPAPMIRIINLDTGRQRFIGYGWYRANWIADSSGVVAIGATPERKKGAVRLSIDRGSDKPKPKVVTDVAGALSPCYSPDGLLLAFVAPHHAADADNSQGAESSAP